MIGTSGVHKSSAAGSSCFQKATHGEGAARFREVPRGGCILPMTNKTCFRELSHGINPCKIVSPAGGVLNTKKRPAGGRNRRRELSFDFFFLNLYQYMANIAAGLCRLPCGAARTGGFAVSDGTDPGL